MRSFVVMLLLIASAIPCMSAPSDLGHEGNGGDVVEAFFIRSGTRLLTKLSRTVEGQRYLQQLPVGLKDLSATLDFRRVSTYDGKLFDVTGASVDAVTDKGAIVLCRRVWLEYLRSATNIDQLVFHEMLRASGVNDDNYIYSSSVSLFSDLYDPREATSLIQYLEPTNIRLNVLQGDSVLSVPTLTKVNSVEMTVEVSSASSTQRPMIRAHQDQDMALNIPVHHSGLMKIVIYRVDYEYEGELQAGSVLKSHREVRFQSSSSFVNQDEQTGLRNQIAISDLMNLQSTYVESLQIKIQNHLEARNKDRRSYLVLKRIVVHFNLLRQ